MTNKSKTVNKADQSSAATKKLRKNIHVSLEQNEYEIIQELAQTAHVSVPQYMRSSAMQEKIVTLGYSGLEDQMALNRASAQELRNLLCHIAQQPGYQPADLILVQQMVDSILQGQQQLVELYVQGVQSVRKYLPC